MKYIKTNRNMNNIAFENIRKEIDFKYNNLHDELSEAYYEKIPFRNYGILNKETFDKLHDLVFLHRDVEFHEKNLKYNYYPEIEYNVMLNSNGEEVSKSNYANEKIAEYKNSGIKLVV